MGSVKVGYSRLYYILYIGNGIQFVLIWMDMVLEYPIDPIAWGYWPSPRFKGSAPR